MQIASPRQGGVGGGLAIPEAYRRRFSLIGSLGKSFGTSFGRAGGGFSGSFGRSSFTRDGFLDVYNHQFGARSPSMGASPGRDLAHFAGLEDNFCKDFFCCGVNLGNLHDLLQHFEECHVRVESDVDEDEDLPFEFESMDEMDTDLSDGSGSSPPTFSDMYLKSHILQTQSSAEAQAAVALSDIYSDDYRISNRTGSTASAFDTSVIRKRVSAAGPNTSTRVKKVRSAHNHHQHEQNPTIPFSADGPTHMVTDMDIDEPQPSSSQLSAMVGTTPVVAVTPAPAGPSTPQGSTINSAAVALPAPTPMVPMTASLMSSLTTSLANTSVSGGTVNSVTSSCSSSAASSVAANTSASSSTLPSNTSSNTSSSSSSSAAAAAATAATSTSSSSSSSITAVLGNMQSSLSIPSIAAPAPSLAAALPNASSGFGESSPLIAQQSTLSSYDSSSLLGSDDNSNAARADDRPYKCKMAGCSKAYKNPGGLKYHMQHGHCEDTGDPEMNNIIHKPYQCTVPDCGKRYKNLNGLKYHIEHAHISLLGAV
ncbi:hypothetical protein HDU86_002101 [Geranomyces michiganensis]|nr:hypothetical protein HDU86_002101 [Geranomyces michiganensis]